jgi:diguanylate cyclase (GGDEF)-like protein
VTDRRRTDDLAAYHFRVALRFGLFGGAVIFMGFVLWDLVYLPNSVARTLPLRLAVSGLLVFMSQLCVWWPRSAPTIFLVALAITSAGAVVMAQAMDPNDLALLSGPLLVVASVAGILARRARRGITAAIVVVVTSNLTMLLFGMAGRSVLFTNVLLLPQLGVLVGMAYLIERGDDEAAALRQALATQATTDELTGLGNRRKLIEDGGRDVALATRHDHPLSVLLLDLDHFKRVNDTWGHGAGDDVLRAVAGALRDELRRTDLAVRWGGEEFLVLLPMVDLSRAHAVGERLRARVAKLEVPSSDGTVSVTTSVGVASRQRGDDLMDMVGRADSALYEAKTRGRNLVVTEKDVPTESLR